METTTKWSITKNREYKSFQYGDEPELIHIIKTGFTDLYIVVSEDADMVNLGKTILLSKQGIKDKFDIDLVLVG